MPFDGDLQPHRGWTITVEPSPVIAKLWWRWTAKQRDAYHHLAAGLAYNAVTCIQKDLLKTRRESLWLPEGIVSYLFRQLRRQHNAILITIFEVEFFGPDCEPPKPGAQAPRPLDPLVLNVSGSGRNYYVDYVEGVLPPPRKDIINRLTVKYAEDRYFLLARGYIGTPIHFAHQTFEIANAPNFSGGWPRLNAPASEPSMVYSSLKIARLLQRDGIPSIVSHSRVSSVGTHTLGTKKFARCPWQGAGISTGIIIATGAQPLPSIASPNSSVICTQRIHPSGSP